MKARVWVNVRIYMDVEGIDENEIRKNAITQLKDVEPETVTEGFNQAEEIGSAYPHDVVEIDEILDIRYDPQRGDDEAMLEG